MEIEENYCSICYKKSINVFSTKSSVIFFKLLYDIYGSLPRNTQNEGQTSKHVCIQCAKNIQTVSSYIKISKNLDLKTDVTESQCRICQENFTELKKLHELNNFPEDFQTKMEFFVKTVLKTFQYEPSWRICLKCSASTIYWDKFHTYIFNLDPKPENNIQTKIDKYETPKVYTAEEAQQNFEEILSKTVLDKKLKTVTNLQKEEKSVLVTTQSVPKSVNSVKNYIPIQVGGKTYILSGESLNFQSNLTSNSNLTNPQYVTQSVNQNLIPPLTELKTSASAYVKSSVGYIPTQFDSNRFVTVNSTVPLIKSQSESTDLTPGEKRWLNELIKRATEKPFDNFHKKCPLPFNEQVKKIPNLIDLSFKEIWKLKYNIASNKQLMVDKPYVRLPQFNFEDYTCSWCRKSFATVTKATKHELRHCKFFSPKVKLERLPNHLVEYDLHGKGSSNLDELFAESDLDCYTMLECETVYSDNDEIVINDSDDDNDNNYDVGNDNDHTYTIKTNKPNYLGAFNTWLNKKNNAPMYLINQGPIGSQGPNLGLQGPTVGLQGSTFGLQSSNLGSHGPTLGSQGPTLGLQGSTLGSQGPTLGSQGLNLGLQGPTVRLQGSFLGSQSPTLGLQGSNLGSQGPTLGLQGPTVGLQGSFLGSQSPTLGLQGSNLGSQGPTVGLQGPTVGLQGSTLGSQGSTLCSQGPTLGLQGPNLGLEGPNLGLQGPNLGLQGPTVGLQGSTLGSQGLTLGSQGTTLGSQGPTLGSEGSTLGSQGPNLGLHGTSLGLQSPTLGLQDTTLGSQGLNLGLQGPTVGLQGSTLGFQGPTLGSQGPALGLQGLTLGSQAPTLGLQGSTVGLQGSNLRLQGSTLGSQGSTLGLQGSTVGLQGPPLGSSIALNPLEGAPKTPTGTQFVQFQIPNQIHQTNSSGTTLGNQNSIEGALKALTGTQFIQLQVPTSQINGVTNVTGTKQPQLYQFQVPTTTINGQLHYVIRSGQNGILPNQNQNGIIQQRPIINYVSQTQLNQNQSTVVQNQPDIDDDDDDDEEGVHFLLRRPKPAIKTNVPNQNQIFNNRAPISVLPNTTTGNYIVFRAPNGNVKRYLIPSNVKHISLGPSFPGVVTTPKTTLDPNLPPPDLVLNPFSRNINVTVRQSQSTVSQSQSTVARSQSTVAQLQSTAAQSQSTVARSQSTVAQLQSTVAKSQSTVAQSQSAVAQSQSTVARSQSTVGQSQSTVARLQSTVAQSESTVAQSESTVAQSESTVAQSESTVAQSQSTVAQSLLTSLLNPLSNSDVSADGQISQNNNVVETLTTGTPQVLNGSLLKGILTENFNKIVLTNVGNDNKNGSVIAPIKVRSDLF